MASGAPDCSEIESTSSAANNYDSSSKSSTPPKDLPFGALRPEPRGSNPTMSIIETKAGDSDSDAIPVNSGAGNDQSLDPKNSSSTAFFSNKSLSIHSFTIKYDGSLDGYKRLIGFFVRIQRTTPLHELRFDIVTNDKDQEITIKDKPDTDSSSFKSGQGIEQCIENMKAITLEALPENLRKTVMSILEHFTLSKDAPTLKF